MDAILELYMKDLLTLGVPSSAGRIDEPISSWSSSDQQLIVKMTTWERWGWLFRFCTADQMRMLLNESRAKAFRSRRTRLGKGSVATEGDLTGMSQHDLAALEGLSLDQYERRLHEARVALSHALSDVTRKAA